MPLPISLEPSLILGVSHDLLISFCLTLTFQVWTYGPYTLKLIAPQLNTLAFPTSLFLRDLCVCCFISNHIILQLVYVELIVQIKKFFILLTAAMKRIVILSKSPHFVYLDV